MCACEFGCGPLPSKRYLKNRFSFLKGAINHLLVDQACPMSILVPIKNSWAFIAWLYTIVPNTRFCNIPHFAIHSSMVVWSASGSKFSAHKNTHRIFWDKIIRKWQWNDVCCVRNDSICPTFARSMASCRCFNRLLFSRNLLLKIKLSSNDTMNIFIYGKNYRNGVYVLRVWMRIQNANSPAMWICEQKRETISIPEKTFPCDFDFKLSWTII